MTDMKKDELVHLLKLLRQLGLPLAARPAAGSLSAIAVMGSSGLTRIRVHGADAGAAAREAASLRRHLLDLASIDIEVAVEKDDANTQDMGATLTIALSAPAIVAVAQGIADWLRKRRIGSTIELEIDGNIVRAGGEIADDPKRLEQLIAALQKGA